jgi:excisionase family DNA binding protein
MADSLTRPDTVLDAPDSPPPPVEPPALLVRPAEAARLLGVSERALWSLTRDGTVPCVRLRRSVRYSVEALREWIARQQAPVARRRIVG